MVSLELLKRKVSPEIFMEFCKESMICPECLAETLTVSRDDPHEIVCKHCGLVVAEQPSQSHSLPGWGRDTNYSDVCNLSFGKSLGTVIGKYQLYSVLAKSPNGKKNLGVRSLQIRNVTKTEIPQIKSLLHYGSWLCKLHNLDGKSEKSVVFAETLGRVLRSVGVCALAMSRGTIQSKKLAEASFVYCYNKTFHDGHDLQEKLRVKNEILDWINKVMNVYALPKSVEIRKSKEPPLPENPILVWECPHDLPVLRLEPKKNKPPKD